MPIHICWLRAPQRPWNTKTSRCAPKFQNTKPSPAFKNKCLTVKRVALRVAWAATAAVLQVMVTAAKPMVVAIVAATLGAEVAIAAGAVMLASHAIRTVRGREK